MNDIAINIKNIHEKILLTQKHYAIQGQPVTLVAVSKNQPVDNIQRALDAGQRVFGENRVQEALEKWPRLKEQYPDIVLHLIGPLQTNKVKYAMQLFDVIEVIDRQKLVDTIVKEAVSLNKNIQYMVQINIGNEPQKAGIEVPQADTFIEQCKIAFGSVFCGVMGIPPVDKPAAPYFALLGKIAKQHQLPCLSMGMSGDFEEAIALGATHVRVGTAIFGKRE
jgi:pyridoxal phosphate enzyme (YggS family)